LIALNSLRIGCVKYLNARPLIRGWPGNVEFDHPSALCQRLARGMLDVALVSSFEFLRNPIYRIVDDVSISSDGPVYSVVVAHRGEFSDIEEIELDPASETSINLLRCLLAERGLKPRLIRNVDFPSLRPTGLQPDLPHAVGNTSARRTGSPRRIRPVADKMPMFRALPRARLLIGDQAVHFRQKHSREFRFWDLGDQWEQLTGVPFVYALWLIRSEVAEAQQIANRLRALRGQNMARLDQLIGETVAEGEDLGSQNVTHEFLGRYYREYLRFNFGEREKQGLQTFGNLCAKHRLICRPDPVLTLV
jgi:chorismate dehydratase